jgi:myo-inositol-1(or 4)-monophosphatase
MAVVPDYLTLCEQAARAGGQALLGWVGRFEAREKGPADLVTEADFASQEAVRQVILSACPDHHFLSEEGGLEPDFDVDYCWVLDPLDGTTNYVHGVPHYAVSLALVESGKPVVGVIYDPCADECFAARRGGGARLNRTAIHTSRATQMERALVAASFAAQVPFPSREVDQFVAALQKCRAVRRTGSAALNLAYVACGRFDAFWALSTKAWDIAAGVLLVEEAGGTVTQLDGSPLVLEAPFPVASATRRLHDEFCRLLQSAAQVS